MTQATDLQIEMRGCVEVGVGGCVEPVSRDKAEFFSLYVGKPGSFACFADVPNELAARAFGEHLASEWGIPFFDRVEK
jgi:hypothetical protein